MDAFHLLVALGPLAFYLFGLGVVNLLGRPVITTGVRDLVALAIALSGLVIVGPMELFVPAGALVVFGPWTWAMLLGFYASGVMFVALALRPRLVIYNANPERIHTILAQIALEMDSELRWSGASLILPQLDIHLQIEPFRAMRNVSLVSVGPRQDTDSWMNLWEHLSAARSPKSRPAAIRGYSLLSFGLILLAMIVWKLVAAGEEVVAQFRDFLRV